MNCDCEKEKKGLLVETEKSFYEIEFAQIQIEITGVCNMKCDHCRAADISKTHMPIDQIIKIIKFARKHSRNYKEIVVSGGEPLIHPEFFKIMDVVRNNGGEFVTLTTNGSLLTSRHLDLFESLNFERLLLSISLDSLNSKEHDSFRHFDGAFKNAIKAIKLIVKRNIPNVVSSVRTTIIPQQISELDRMADFVYNLGCRRFSVSSIIPAGRAKNNHNLLMTTEQKKSFIEKIYSLKSKYNKLGFDITTNDPLKCLLRGSSEIGVDDDLIFDGCPAAACTFNVNPNGDMTPCALMDLVIMNTFDLSINEMEEKYRNSEIVKNMLDMNLEGKCGRCDKKYQCGGCRARALAINKNYLAEDPDCWLNI